MSRTNEFNIFRFYLCKILNLFVFEMWIVQKNYWTTTTTKSKIRLFMIEAKYGNRHRNRTISINYEYWWWCRLIIIIYIRIHTMPMWNVFVIFVHMHWESGENVTLRIVNNNKQNGYAIVTNVYAQYNNLSKWQKFWTIELMRQAYTSSCVGTIVFNSYFIFSTCSPVILVIIDAVPSRLHSLPRWCSTYDEEKKKKTFQIFDFTWVMIMCWPFVLRSQTSFWVDMKR